MKHWNKISFALSCAAGFGLWKYGFLLRLTPGDLRTFLGLLAQVSVTMLGFLLAALSILASISGQRLIRNMQKTGHFRVLLRKMFFNTLAYGVATALSLCAYLLKANLIVAAVVTSVSVLFASMMLAGVGWMLWLVLSNLSPDKSTE